MKRYKELYSKWRNYNRIDIELKTELLKMTESEIEDAFYKDLEFGTGGLRGLLGPGTNRLNIYTIRKNTEGLARYIESFGKQAKDKGIVIAYDNRHKSQEFAYECAKVLAKHQITSFIFESLRPTPQLSFTVRELQAFGGIVITASHNSKEYNGYKVYNDKGCQCVPSETNVIIGYIRMIEDPISIEVADSKLTNQYRRLLSTDIDERYYQKIKEVQLHPELDKSNCKIVFSPQHGAANIPVRTILDRFGYEVFPVESQCQPDPDFSNTKSPNPENPEAFEKGIELAIEKDADAVIATDPDSDRVGIAVKHGNTYVCLTGNQIGAILLEYILRERKHMNQLPKDGIVFNTIVTSDIGKQICHEYGVSMEATLTGFKFIGDQIGRYEEMQTKTFLFGYEESFGYLIKDFSRDKDAVQASILLCEVVNFYKQKGLDLIDVMQNLYAKYGYYEDHLFSITLKGINGANKIKGIMNVFQNIKDSRIGIHPIIAVENYLESLRYEGSKAIPIALPKANVIKIFIEDGSWITVRPSGTEPKCKFYYCTKGKNSEDAKEKRIYLHKCILNMIDAREEINLKKALITGITGQDGSYLAELLLEKGYEVHGVIRRASTFNTKRIDHLMNDDTIYNKKFFIHHGDMTDSSNINRLIEKIRPDEIYNLAAQSHVKVSFDVPEFTADTDALGVLRILDAIRESGIQCRFYQASTSELFGGLPESAPQNENTPLYPKSPYGVAKLYGYWITVNYRESYGLYACNGILFNHESPRRGETFVTRKITMAVANIMAGKQNVLTLGNMDAKRDWGYAKDYVEAMWLLLQQDKADDYVISTNETHTVREFVELSFKEVGITIEWQGEGVNEKGIDKDTGRVLVDISERYFRPAEVDLLWGDCTKAETELKWERKTSFQELVSMMVDEDMKEYAGMSSDDYRNNKKVKG